MSGHAFAIGQHTGLIIDCVVYSTACKQCETNDKDDTTIGDDDSFWQSSNLANNNVTKKHTLVNPLENNQQVSLEEMSTNMIMNNTHTNCPCNYSGSSGAMDSDGMLFLMKRVHTVMQGKILYEYIVSDDDNKMKKYLTHPATRPTGKKNIGGRLPKEIPEPKWFADPTHRAKCVAGAFFDLVKSHKKMTKLDALRLKKYYSYYIKQNRHKTMKDLRENSMAPLFHLFDDHHLCDPSWCHKRKTELTPSDVKEVGGGEADAADILPATPPTIMINDDDGVAITVADDDDVAALNDDDDDVIAVAANDDDEADAVGVVPTTPPATNTFDSDATIVTPANPIPTLGESNTNQENNRDKASADPDSPSHECITPTPILPSTKSISERDRQGYYRDMLLDKDLWDALVDKYERYRSKEMLAQCVHEYDTQKKGMNTCVAKYAPKNKTYCKSISLETRVKVAAGIYIVGYHFIWTEVMKELRMDISPHFEAYLLQRDERKVSKFNREHARQ